MRTVAARWVGTALGCALVAILVWAAAGSAPVEAQDAASESSAPVDMDRGEELFDLCTYCHGAEGLGNAQLGAPAIAGMPQWYVTAQLRKFRGGLRGLHPDDLAGMRMRPMSLTLTRPGDLESVAAYTSSLSRKKPEPTLTGGDPAKGAGLYAVCAACHGPDAQGNEALGAPPLTHSGDWYVVAQYKKFQAGIRGANPKDTAGASMRPMAMVLQGEQAMKDVAAHIMTLSK